MESIGEILAYFKALEEDDVENITPLIENAELRSGIVAWKSVFVKFNDAGAQFEGNGDVDKWKWLWTQVEYDKSEIGTVAGLRTQDIGGVLSRLIGLRLIYPDGTINGMARQFLQAQIMAKLTGKRSPGRPIKDTSAQK